MAEPNRTHFYVVKSDPLSGQRSLLGKLGLEDNGMLKLVSAEPSHQKFLQDLVSSINRKPLLHVSVMPPPDAPRYATYSQAIERTDPQFLEALQCFLAKNYRVFLSLTESIEDAVFPETMLQRPGESF